MKYIFSIFLFFCFCASADAQDTTTFRISADTLVDRTIRLTIDTNELVYTKRGKSLRYYQYKRLLESGKYMIRIEENGGRQQRKLHLIKTIR